MLIVDQISSTSWYLGLHEMYVHGFRFFSRLVGRSDPWIKKWWVIFWNGGPRHIKTTTVDIWVSYFTYTLTLLCIMYNDCWLYSKTCLKWPLKKEDQLLLDAGQKCSPWSILQSFRPSLRYHLFLRSFWVAAYDMFYCIDNLHVLSVLRSLQTHCKMNIFY